MANETTDKDARIKELEGLLASVEKTHAFQADRADKLEAELKAAIKRADDFEKKSKKQGLLPAPDGDRVVLGGVSYRVTGTFRADNTFVEVKRGHCNEGVTLVAIDKTH